MYKVIKRAISRELAEFCYDYLCNKKKVVRLLYDARYISQFNVDWGGGMTSKFLILLVVIVIWLWKLYWKKYIHA